MKKSSDRFFLKNGLPIVLAVLLSIFWMPPYHNVAQSQGRQGPGESIGTIRTQGDLIVMTLNEGALGKANMFDLGRHTLRFTPEGAGYRAENGALKWDAEFGTAITNPQVTLRNFTFPFSGKSWDALSVGLTG